MEERSTNDGDEQRPRWVPYTPPPPDGWDRVRLAVRRLTFPVMVVLFAVGLAGVFYWSTQMNGPADSPAAVNVAPFSGGEANRAEQGPPAQLPVTIRSTPTGATVRLNGDSVGTTPLTDRILTEGVYMLSVQAPGHFRADTVVVLRDDPPRPLRFALRPRPGADAGPTAAARPEPAPPEPAPTAERPLPVTSVPSPERTPPPETPALGALYVTSAPPGAVVTVAGAERGRTPLSISRLPPGTTPVALRLDGYEAWRTRVDVEADTTRRVHAELRARTGRLRVLARPWGTIYIDDILHARESDVWYETPLPAGTHRITVVHPALGQRVQDVQVRAGEETAVVVDLQAPADGPSR
jgi:hypothetical protein